MIFMGKILSIKSINEEKVNLTLELTSAEYSRLKGNLEKVHVFSENILEFSTRLVQRGKRESTKYILMPKEFRKFVIPTNNVSCNIIETKTKNIMIFSTNKF